MMKKEYIQPVVKVYTINRNTILAGSVEVKPGSTNEQNAKGMDFYDINFTTEDGI